MERDSEVDIESAAPKVATETVASENFPRLKKEPRIGQRITEAFRSSNKLATVGDKKHNEIEDENESKLFRYDTLILLFFVGLITGVVNGSVLWATKQFSAYQSALLTYYELGPLYLIITTTTLCVLSAFIIRKGKMVATLATGMPEVKALIVKDHKASEYPRLVSLKIGLLRVTSLVLAACSGLSVGLQGPLVHVSVCTSYVLATWLPTAHSMLDNPSIMRQVFAASAAVGLATVFNSPVGGLLFSVEVTSTYYLISNYWRSFMAATTGAVMYSIFLINRKEEPRIFEVDYVKDPYHEWELLIYMLLGVIAGVLALLFLHVHQVYYVFMRGTLRKYPLTTTGAVAAFTALMIYALRMHSNNGLSVGVIVHDAFQNCTISTIQSYDVTVVGGLIISLIMRVILTILATTLQISCGLFMPMLSIGALLGRIVGQIVLNRNSDYIYVPGYAMVGAAAFISGTTHTISAAVIVIEMTGQINMLLPCLLGAVIACGITKTRSLSLYDQGMVNKGLESFELLLLTSDGFCDVLDKDVISVTSTCQIADLFLMLENSTQSIFPVIESVENNKLIGSIQRRNVYLYLKSTFTDHNILHYVRGTLIGDTEIDDNKILPNMKPKPLSPRARLVASIRDTSQEIGKQIRENVVSMRIAIEKLRNPDKETTTESNGENNTEMTGNPIPDRSFRTSTHSGQSLINLTSMHLNNSHIGTSVSLTPAEAVQVETLLSQNILLSKEPLLEPNNFPFTVPEHSTMDNLYVLFEMVKVPSVFVLGQKGKLKGMISRDNLLQNLRSKVQ